MNEETLRWVADKHTAFILQPYDIILRTSGFDALSTVCECLGGTTVYIPKLQTVLKRCLEQEARSEFTGFNYTELAHKYGFSERQLRKIVRDLKQ
jgi:Mor family transcriptional regulator